MLTAWGDESVSNTVRDPGTYILAVALTFDEHLDGLRDAVEKLRPHRARKLHWHDDRDARHHTVLRELSTLPSSRSWSFGRRRVTDWNTVGGSVWTFCSGSWSNWAAPN